MLLIDANKMFLDDLQANPLETLPNALSNTRLANLTLQSVSGVSLFILSLFIPMESTLNIAYSLPVNHRLADQAHLLADQGQDTSIAEAIYLDATGKCSAKSTRPPGMFTYY
jgi:hypothetical protein